jgi:ribosome biogenesis GTPase / thiamine phosphate phosphatase
MDLKYFGWNDYFQDHFNAYQTEGFIPARVVRENRQQYLIQSQFGELSAEVSGRFLYQTEDLADFPAAGDWVAALPFLDEQKAIIQAVLPRRNQFSRAVAGGRTEEQVTAANIDLVIIVTGLDTDFNIRRLERYLILARESGAKPIVVLNKADLCNDLPEKIAAVAALASGLEAYAVSAMLNSGMEPLKKSISEGQSAVFLGSSGVGKSSIINRLIGYERQYVNNVRDTDGRGQHTTTFRELILLPSGGVIIDSPGMRELKLWSSSESLSETFTDIVELAKECKFRNCRHESEPGCAIREAIEDGRLDPGRFRNYNKLQREIMFLERRKNNQTRQYEKNFAKKVRQHSRKIGNEIAFS